MDIHEYQAKEILARHGVPVPRGQVAFSPEQASLRARELGGSSWVVKAQVHTGGRGQAGGVKLCHSEREVADVAEAMFGRRLVTKQSQPNGKIINRVHVEVGCDIEREIYFGLVVDRATQCVMVIASAQGGMEIEEVAERDPDAIVRMAVEPAVGFCDFQARELAFALGLPNEVLARTTQAFRGAYRAFRDLDVSMLEINPLVITADGDVLALDAKLSFDDNALFRHPEIADLRDRSQEDPRESHAADRGLAYVGLDGDIGCVINGAGLAMATLDMIQLAGGEPANFLDIGGGASPERVMKAFRAVLADDNVRVILVNIFAGINRCDWVAQGIVEAFAALKIEVPVVVRLAGTNVEEGRRIIAESGLPLRTAESLAEAAQFAVDIARVRAA